MNDIQKYTLLDGTEHKSYGNSNINLYEIQNKYYCDKRTFDTTVFILFEQNSDFLEPMIYSKALFSKVF